MKSTIYSLAIAIFVFAGCRKDSVNTKPSLTFKSVSNKVVPLNGGTSFTLTFGDKEGDIDSLFIYRVRLNAKKALETINNSFALKVADYNKSQTGEIQLDFYCKDAAGCATNYYQNYLISAKAAPTSGTPPKNEADSILYKFVARDKEKNVSDTVYYSPIVIIR